MKVHARYVFASERQRLWDLLLDVDVIQQCIPGLEKLEPQGDGKYRATVKVGISAVKGTYQGTITIGDEEPIEQYRMSVDGRGRAGWARGYGLLIFAEAGEGTSITVDGDLQIGGLIARVGQRLIGNVMKSLMDQFFDSVREQAEENSSQVDH